MNGGNLVDSHVASWEVAKLTRKKSRVMLVAVALGPSESILSNDRVYLQASSQKHNKDSNLLLPMQL